MRYQTLDGIVRSALLQRGYSLHWYLQALKAASDCLRELTFDTLKNVNTVKLPVSDTGVVTLPCDYVDIVKLGLEVGQYVKPLVPKDGINRLQNTDSNGLPINYDNIPFSNSALTEGEYYRINWAERFSADGEPLGRDYGFNAGWIQDGYKVIRERGEIQLDQQLITDFVYLEYISDGQSSDNATKVHPYAQSTIEKYIFWQFKEHSRAYSPGERQIARNEFSIERRILRARLNGLTADQIKRIVNKSYTASIK